MEQMKSKHHILTSTTNFCVTQTLKQREQVKNSFTDDSSSFLDTADGRMAMCNSLLLGWCQDESLWPSPCTTMSASVRTPCWYSAGAVGWANSANKMSLLG